jgi:hypothetical protein
LAQNTHLLGSSAWTPEQRFMEEQWRASERYGREKSGCNNNSDSYNGCLEVESLYEVEKSHNLVSRVIFFN